MVQVFPSVRSLEHLAGAVMCEQDDAWSETRYFFEAKISELYEERLEPQQPTEERPQELGEVTRKAIGASLELADKMEAA